MCSIRKLGLLFIIVIFSFGNLQAANDVVIWHIPHPDDETLGMGGSIYRNGQEGKRNIIVFYTGGGASGVRHLLNGRFYSSFLERRLRPEEEGYEPLTVKEFEQARIKESRAALHVLGVKDEDILEVGLKDSALTVGDVISAMEELHRLYPYAAHRTTAISDSYPDHQTMARALYRFARDKGIDISSYQVYTYYLPVAERGRGAERVEVDLEVKGQALREFAVFNPEKGRFAIGRQSVPELFTEAAKDPYEYKEEIPARALYNPVAVGVSCKGITLDYLVCDNWRFRIDNSWNCREQAVLLKRNSVHLAHVFQLYLGGGGYFAKERSLGYVVGSDFIRHFFVEYNWKGKERNWKYGFRLHY